MKKSLLILTSMFTAASALAQLNVKGDNYVFVTKEQLYVKEEVNLQDAASTLYLRDEAQLIQGTETTYNQGIGNLSVYQEGTVNQYAYNYWASPVGNIAANNSVNRNFIPTGNIQDVTGLTTSTPAAYTAMTSYDGTSGPLTIAQYWLWKYLPGTTYADWDFVGATGFVEPGLGFTMKGTNAGSQQYDFRGKPNTGTITASVISGQETLVGNPYPSAIDAHAVIHDPINAALLDSGTLRFWEQDATVNSHILVQYRGGYATYTVDAIGGTETYVPASFSSYTSAGDLSTTGTASTTGKVAKRHIPIGQGFFIKGSANGSFTMKNSFRTFKRESVAADNSAFFKTISTGKNYGKVEENKNNLLSNKYVNNTAFIYDENGFQILDSDYKRFRLNVDFNETYTRQLLQNFHESATDGADYGLETRFPEMISSDIYFEDNAGKLNANALQYDIDTRIPLRLTLAESQPVRFRIVDVQNFNPGQEIFVHDKDTDKYYDLSNTPYEVNLDKGEYYNRFEITFRNFNKEIVDTINSDNDIFNILQNNNTATLSLINPTQSDVALVSVYDVAGKRVYNAEDMNTSSQYDINTNSLSEGVYIVKVNFENGSSKAKKVIVKGTK